MVTLKVIVLYFVFSLPARAANHVAPIASVEKKTTEAFFLGRVSYNSPGGPFFYSQEAVFRRVYSEKSITIEMLEESGQSTSLFFVPSLDKKKFDLKSSSVATGSINLSESAEARGQITREILYKINLDKENSLIGKEKWRPGYLSGGGALLKRDEKIDIQYFGDGLIEERYREYVKKWGKKSPVNSSNSFSFMVKEMQKSFSQFPLNCLVRGSGGAANQGRFVALQPFLRAGMLLEYLDGKKQSRELIFFDKTPDPRIFRAPGSAKYERVVLELSDPREIYGRGNSEAWHFSWKVLFMSKDQKLSHVEEVEVLDRTCVWKKKGLSALEKPAIEFGRQIYSSMHFLRARLSGQDGVQKYFDELAARPKAKNIYCVGKRINASGTIPPVSTAAFRVVIVPKARRLYFSMFTLGDDYEITQYNQSKDPSVLESEFWIRGNLIETKKLISENAINWEADNFSFIRKSNSTKPNAEKNSTTEWTFGKNGCGALKVVREGGAEINRSHFKGDVVSESLYKATLDSFLADFYVN